MKGYIISGVIGLATGLAIGIIIKKNRTAKALVAKKPEEKPEVEVLAFTGEFKAGNYEKAWND